MLASWHVGARRRTSLRYVATQSSTVERSLVRYFAPLCLMLCVVATYHQEGVHMPHCCQGNSEVTIYDVFAYLLKYRPKSTDFFTRG